MYPLCDQVWNIQNGHEQHLLESGHDSDIVNVLLCDDRSTALSVATNHTIIKYPMEGLHEVVSNSTMSLSVISCTCSHLYCACAIDLLCGGRRWLEERSRD